MHPETTYCYCFARAQNKKRIPWRGPPKGRRDPKRGPTLPPAPANRSSGPRAGRSSRHRGPRKAAPGPEKECPQDVSSLAGRCNTPSPKVFPTAVTGGITAAEESNRTQKVNTTNGQPGCRSTAGPLLRGPRDPTPVRIGNVGLWEATMEPREPTFQGERSAYRASGLGEPRPG